MFDALLKSKFYSKCKSDLKAVRARIEIIMKKRNATQKYLRNDVADLLKNGLDYNAYGRAEGLLAEMTRSQCYDLIDQYCDHILKNLTAMDKQRECLEECREAAAGLMFAAARFADLPELRQLRSIFAERYGNSLDYYVNKQFSEKLKSGLPSNEMKLQLLQEVAAESGLEWSSKALENELFCDSVHKKNVVKVSNESEDFSDDHRDGSVQKHARAGSRYEFYPVRELNPEPEKGNEQKEATRSTPVKDIQVDTIGKHQQDENNPPKYKWVPPPYTKGEVGLSVLSDADENHGKDDHVLEAKAKVKSVRTRTLKPSRGEESGTNKDQAALGQRILKFFDGGGPDQPEEDEKVMDKLLQHYSRKKGPHLESSDVKPTYQRSSTELSYAEKRRRDGPNRVSSLPSGVTPPAENPKTHVRAASFHPDAHVHPKLPDYDDFVARLAAFRGK
ncbi:hypothetical protein ACS0TY_035094 [Phlomoides rotata]